ncbi:cupin domain-containing protein [Idiomarina sp. HP20-50]|uniref:cupin domain-containing protein n=1 Tax=Idiomarina sp. HP20-50 TaxID=3070813 RepID=UPI00294B6D26|nr:cupin domain-containing protein [Idiomarina sp. HP20-50]MDV6315089.1 cupin domain-containing protein [Idiomarina sp. HP20-50]
MKLAFDKHDFLANYWQKKPCLIRQGFTNFTDPVSPEILAGLAMEEGADSRVIQSNTGTDSGWLVTHGPFEDYEKFGESDWTLLVQSVNEWLPDVGDLITPFRFLPDWRIDDVMVSFSCENGGVGPHLDQYDVFIIQGAGSRHWRVGERQSMQEYQPASDLCQVKGEFKAIIDENLSAGDVLYIPAGCPHEGIALEPSLNYSVGFRAPSKAELLLQLGDIAMQQESLQKRYQDPGISAEDTSWEIQKKQLVALKSFLKEALSSDETDALLARIVSQSKRPLPEPELPTTAQQIPDLLSQPNAFIEKASGARFLKLSDTEFYGNGEAFSISADALSTAQWLAQLQGSEPASALAELAHSESQSELIAEMINQGIIYLYIDES